MQRRRLGCGPRRVLWLIALSVVSAGSTGCAGALAGHWYLFDATPNRQTFGIDDATFNADGTYAATTTIEGQTNHEKGTYDFTGSKLRLRPAGGGQRTYSATLKIDRLELLNGKRSVVLKKGVKGG